jgi:hypothetical protein
MAHDISKLSHWELLSLWEAVSAARDFLDNFNMQGRFRDPDADDPRGVVTWNGAGNIVDDLARELGVLGDEVADRARVLPAVSDDERQARAMLLIKEEINYFACSPEDAEKALALVDSQREGAPS